MTGCSSGTEKPKPTELAANVVLMGVHQAWAARTAPLDKLLLTPAVAGQRLAVAGGDGSVALLDAQSGAEVWRAQVGQKLAAGVGSDGHLAAVITRDNQVVTLEDGKQLWRQRLPVGAYTAPLVAGGRVFVLGADRSVNAFDGRNGALLWSLQRPVEPLVLKKPGLLTVAPGNQLIAGLSGRMVSIDPDRGTINWEVPVAAPRGTNDVERLVDIANPVARDGEVLCARTFEATVGCVDTNRAQPLWIQLASGATGLSMDERYVYGTESDGKVMAWSRAGGKKAWTSQRLRYRGLTAPQAVGRSVAIGDASGLVHLVSREDGSLLNRLPTDGSPIAATPVLAGNTLVVVTQNGGVFGFRPE